MSRVEHADPSEFTADSNITLGLRADPSVLGPITTMAGGIHMARRTPNFPLTGPLAPFEDGFLARLGSLGYVSSGFVGQRALLAHLDRWMGSAGLTVADLTPALVEKFLNARVESGYVTKLTEHGLTPVLEYLEQLGHYRKPIQPVTSVEEVVIRFRRHLLEERGLGDATVGNHERVARQFLSTRPDPLEASLAELITGDVIAFIRERSRWLGVSGMQNAVQGLRALMKFLYLAGLTDRTLASAVPSVARRRQELPRALPKGHVEQLLRSCDRNSSVGVRDFAILTVLARLGVRADEVAHLELNDIDWRAGDVRIRGKGPRVDKLPLPTDVGEAIIDYLRRARPNCSQQRLFIRSCAPRQGLSRQAIGGLVRAASVRAGLLPHGPHRLRHTVATELLRQGAPLAEIAQLLRHQSVQTTVIYAKVDRQALSSLAQMWPEAAQ
jgi:integrase/recombinase XerD